jgi:23S rRNA pseudouridine1911/1915/1917 synthase
LDRLRCQASQEESGERLDTFVARHAGLSRTRAQGLIQEGEVLVGGKPAVKNHRLRTGEWVEIAVPEPRPPQPLPQEIPIDILYEDKDLAVIYKPAGMVVHPAPGHEDGTLVNALLHALKDLSGVGGVLRPGIVHRLDRYTSGLMVVAKNDSSHIKLQEMIGERVLKRVYLALVHGLPSTRLGKIEAPVGRDPADRKKMAVTADTGRPATTNFQVIEYFSDASLLEVELVTGRTHQIRVHLSYIGHAVVGDTEYGRIGELERELGLERQFLHAYKISFPHPISGSEISLEQPLPHDLQSALERLRERE